MQRSRTRRVLINSFWLSVLLHLLFLFGFSVSMVLIPKEEEKKPPEYMRSYLYTGAITPSGQQQHSSPPADSEPSSQRTSISAQNNQDEMNAGDSENLLDTKAKLSVNKSTTSPKTRQERSSMPNNKHRKSMLAASMDVLQETQRQALNAQKDEEPIYLVGDMNALADPIIKLLGRALTAHFQYPKVAAGLGVSGRVLISLTLHPEGHFSDIQMVSSSNNSDLDTAALYAVNTAPRVVGADRFLTKPKHFVVGFIFRIDRGLYTHD